ncbi:hypothetical protein ACFP1Z_13490 [Streptomyces gamaensis]|uniref:2-phospho-L-lactate guanylyltransferase n=1 Tax=Streptomyces gamaensis TaxID=1763542 RepID=A0ABW0YX59_9ACTN
MQATAYTFDPGTRSGSVLLDDGTPLSFDAAAFDAGGLRLLRPGQRVRIVLEETENETEDGTGEESGRAGQDAQGAAGGPRPDVADSAGGGAGSGGQGAAQTAQGPFAGRRVTLVTLQTF